jgi:hypothetical protein
MVADDQGGECEGGVGGVCQSGSPTDVILRSLRSKRLEGWIQYMGSRLILRGSLRSHLRMTSESGEFGSALLGQHQTSRGYFGRDFSSARILSASADVTGL